MAAPLKAGLPPGLELAAGYQIRLVALDPTTGNEVSGVVLQNIAFTVTDILGSAAGPDDTPNPLLVPSHEEV